MNRDRSGVSAAMALATMAMAGGVAVAETEPRPKPTRTRRVVKQTVRDHRRSIPFGDGFDQDRLDRAERKRAMRAAKLR